MEVSIQPEAIASKQITSANHKDDDCPNVDAIKKLKGEVKRLRQELILNPKKRQETSEDEQESLDEQEKAALRMLSDE